MDDQDFLDHVKNPSKNTPVNQSLISGNPVAGGMNIAGGTYGTLTTGFPFISISPITSPPASVQIDSLKPPLWYVLDKNLDPIPVDILVASAWLENNNNRIVLISEIDKDCRLSTVFLGLDHSFSFDGQPILFESMWFGGPDDGKAQRYCTWKEAIKGHKKMLKQANFDNFGFSPV